MSTPILVDRPINETSIGEAGVFEEVVNGLGPALESHPVAPVKPLPSWEPPMPPSQYDLPSSDEIPMETQRHRCQMEVLINGLQSWLNARSNGFVGGNMFVYFSLDKVRNQDFRGPDVFVVLDVPKRERLSWVVWEETKSPDVIIELLSQTTVDTDKKDKKLIYQNQLKVSEYFWFDPFNAQDWEGFSLNSNVYEPIPLNEQGQMISQVLGLSLVCWSGLYQGINATWLRWATLEGELLPLPQEIAQQEAQRANQEAQRANQAESQLRQVAIALKQQGMNPAQIASLTGLSETEIETLN